MALTKIKSTGIDTLTTDVSLADSTKIKLGAGNDLQIYHNGSNQDRIDSSSTYLILEAYNHIFRKPGGSEDYAKFLGDGAVELYHNNVKKLETDAAGVNIIGGLDVTNITSTGTINMSHDGATLFFGADVDMRIKHDGSTGTIQCDTGILNVTNDDIRFKTSGAETMLRAVANGAVELMHNNVTKLTTTSTGINVAGTISGATTFSSAASFSSNVTIGGNLTVNGTQTTINSTTLTIDDLNIVLAQGAGTAAAANAAGITIDGAGAVMQYLSSGDEFHFNKDIRSDVDITATGQLAGGSLSVDTVSINGSTYATSGNMVFDSANDILLDADGGNVSLRDDGTPFGNFNHNGNNLKITSAITNGHIVLEPNGTGNVGIGAGSPAAKLEVKASNTGTSDWANKGIMSSVQINAANRTFGGLTMVDHGSGSGHAGLGFRYDGAGYKLELGTASSTGSGISTHLTIDRLGAIVTSGHLDIGNELTIPNKIIHAGDTNTYLEFNANDSWRVVTGDEERIKANNGEVVVNDNSADMDFRVESNASTHQLFVDSTNSKVLVSSNNTASVTDSASALAARAFEVNGNASEGSDNLSIFAMADGTGNYGIEVSNSPHTAQYDLLLNPIKGGNVGIGRTSANYLLHAENALSTGQSVIATSANGEFIMAMGSQNSPGVAQEAFIGTLNDTRFKIKVNNVVKGSWTSGGLAIGTHSSASAPLDVVTNSNVYAAEFTQSNTSNGDGVFISVGSTAGADYALTVRSNNGNHSVLAAKANGQVGIGVFVPDRMFHVKGDATNVVGKFESTDGIAAIEFTDPSGSAEIGNNGNDLVFFPAGADKGRFQSTTGQFLVATDQTASNCKVHVAGGIRFNAFSPGHGLNTVSYQTFNNSNTANACGSVYYAMFAINIYHNNGHSQCFFVSNGGGGVGYNFTGIVPGNTNLVTGTGINTSFTTIGSSPNTFQIQISSGGGALTVSRSNGTGSFGVSVHKWAGG